MIRTIASRLSRFSRPRRSAPVAAAAAFAVESLEGRRLMSVSSLSLEYVNPVSTSAYSAKLGVTDTDFEMLTVQQKDIFGNWQTISGPSDVDYDGNGFGEIGVQGDPQAAVDYRVQNGSMANSSSPDPWLYISSSLQDVPTPTTVVLTANGPSASLTWDNDSNFTLGEYEIYEVKGTSGGSSVTFVTAAGGSSQETVSFSQTLSNPGNWTLSTKRRAPSYFNTSSQAPSESGFGTSGSVYFGVGNATGSVSEPDPNTVNAPSMTVSMSADRGYNGSNLAPRLQARYTTTTSGGSWTTTAMVSATLDPLTGVVSADVNIPNVTAGVSYTVQTRLIEKNKGGGDEYGSWGGTTSFTPSHTHFIGWAGNAEALRLSPGTTGGVLVAKYDGQNAAVDVSLNTDTFIFLEGGGVSHVSSLSNQQPGDIELWADDAGYEEGNLSVTLVLDDSISADLFLYTMGY